MIWRDHVLNFGSKSATRVTKFREKNWRGARPSISPLPTSCSQLKASFFSLNFNFLDRTLFQRLCSINTVHGKPWKGGIFLICQCLSPFPTPSPHSLFLSIQVSKSTFPKISFHFESVHVHFDKILPRVIF